MLCFVTYKNHPRYFICWSISISLCMSQSLSLSNPLSIYLYTDIINTYQVWALVLLETENKEMLNQVLVHWLRVEMIQISCQRMDEKIIDLPITAKAALITLGPRLRRLAFYIFKNKKSNNSILGSGFTSLKMLPHYLTKKRRGNVIFYITYRAKTETLRGGRKLGINSATQHSDTQQKHAVKSQCATF